MKIGEEADEIIKKINLCRSTNELNAVKDVYLKTNANSIDLNEFFIEQETRISFGFASKENKNNEFLGRKRKGDPTNFIKKIEHLSPSNARESKESKQNEDNNSHTSSEVCFNII